MVVLGLVLFALWGWQLINCIGRDEFPALYSSQGLARIAWVASFFLFDPVQLVLYVTVVRYQVFGRKLSKLGSSVLVLGFAVIGVEAYGLPSKSAPRGQAIRAMSANTGLGLNATVQKLSQSASRVSTRTVLSSPLALRWIRVLVESDDPLAVDLAERLGARLAALPYVERVTLGSPEDIPEEGQAAFPPDMTLILRAGLIRVLPLPFWYRSSGNFALLFGSGINGLDSTYPKRDPRIALESCSWSMDLEFDYGRSGLAWGAARLGLQASDLAKIAGDSLVKFLDQRHQVTYDMPVFPIVPKYKAFALPEALVKRKVRRCLSESALFVHSRTLMTYAQEGSNREAMEELGADLELDGWEFHTWESTLVARRGDGLLVAGRPGYYEPEPSETPVSINGVGDEGTSQSYYFQSPAHGVRGDIRVVYEERYSDAEFDQVVAQLIASNSDPVHRLLLYKHLDREQLIKLRKDLEDRNPNKAAHWLRIADLAKSVDDRKAEEYAARRARAVFDNGVADASVLGELKMLEKQLESVWE